MQYVCESTNGDILFIYQLLFLTFGFFNIKQVVIIFHNSVIVALAELLTFIESEMACRLRLAASRTMPVTSPSSVASATPTSTEPRRRGASSLHTTFTVGSCCDATERAYQSGMECTCQSKTEHTCQIRHSHSVIFAANVRCFK